MDFGTRTDVATRELLERNVGRSRQQHVDERGVEEQLLSAASRHVARRIAQLALVPREDGVGQAEGDRAREEVRE